MYYYILGELILTQFWAKIMCGKIALTQYCVKIMFVETKSTD